jgi:hypothetical protein
VTLRRHHAAVLPISQLALPQCLLGAEAQLRAFVAAAPALAPRLFFAPLPEMFCHRQSLARVWAVTGASAGGPAPVHLRFGGVRSVRVMRAARNGVVLAEGRAAAVLTPSRHPFADGTVVPAAVERLFTWTADTVLPSRFGGDTVPATQLPDGTIGADLGATAMRGGLDLVSLRAFSADAFTADAVGDDSADLHAAGDAAPFVLVPWNLAHPGSIVPRLVQRMLHVLQPARPDARLVLLPFNECGQIGELDGLVRLIRKHVAAAEAQLACAFVARVRHLGALPRLRRLAPVAWLDPHDPEHDWTARRLGACGFAPVTLPADETLTIHIETGFGLLSFATAMPSLRSLRILLHQAQQPPVATAASGPRARTARHRGA